MAGSAERAALDETLSEFRRQLSEIRTIADAMMREQQRREQEQTGGQRNDRPDERRRR